MALSPMFCRRPSAERTSPLPSSAQVRLRAAPRLDTRKVSIGGKLPAGLLSVAAR